MRFRPCPGTQSLSSIWTGLDGPTPPGAWPVANLGSDPGLEVCACSREGGPALLKLGLPGLGSPRLESSSCRPGGKVLPVPGAPGKVAPLAAGHGGRVECRFVCAAGPLPWGSGGRAPCSRKGEQWLVDVGTVALLGSCFTTP